MLNSDAWHLYTGGIWLGVDKPYNLNFLNPENEDSFYCSQLAYKAYQQIGINLNTGLTMENLPGTNAIIYPQEIWDGFSHKIVEGRKKNAQEGNKLDVTPPS